METDTREPASAGEATGLRRCAAMAGNGIVRRDWEPQSDALRATFISQPLARLVAHIAAPCA